MRPVEFWFEFASTYSYVAAMRVEAVASSRNVPLLWRPFLLGPLFQRQGWNDSPYNLYPARGRYMWRDIERLCDRHGIPFRRPSVFPRHSVLAARVAVLAQEEPWMPEFARSLYRANFAEDRDISRPDLIRALLDARGLDAEALLQSALSPDNKARLRAQTERAWELGICGAPSFIVDGELFWGQDRMDQAFEWRLDPARAGGA